MPSQPTEANGPPARRDPGLERSVSTKIMVHRPSRCLASDCGSLARMLPVLGANGAVARCRCRQSAMTDVTAQQMTLYLCST